MKPIRHTLFRTRGSACELPTWITNAHFSEIALRLDKRNAIRPSSKRRPTKLQKVVLPAADRTYLKHPDTEAMNHTTAARARHCWQVHWLSHGTTTPS